MSILAIDTLHRTFRGYSAVTGVSLRLEQGELRGLIGANGAGKSTLLHLIYGKILPDSGTITFDGHDVTRMPAFARARLGMGLKFQVTSVFDDLSVEENLLLGAHPKVSGTAGTTADRDELARVLDMIELAGSRNRRARHLSHGEKQWLEIGMVLLTRPKLLLLDEPTSGMTRAESRRTAGLLRDLQAARAADAMVVVEHNIEFIRLVSDRVTVMHRGRVLADGTIDEVQANTDVQASYLGRQA